MYTKPPVLTPRLLKVASLVKPCSCFADIGTDHAYLPVFLCMTGVCSTAIASDIEKGPLARAERTLNQYGLEDKIQLRLGPGLDTLNPGEADTIAISGMGGIVISNILQAGREKLTESTNLILQPMTSIPELREFLWKKGWKICRELLAKEDEKIYNIIMVSHTQSNIEPKPTPAQLYLGRHIIENKPEHYEEYLDNHKGKIEKMIKGLEASQSEVSKNKLEYCKSLLKEIEKL